MASEDKVHTTERDKVLKKSAESSSPEPTLLDSWLEIQRLKRESASARDQPEYAAVEMTDEQMEALSDEELDAHIDLHEKQVKLDELQKELDRRALNMGLLKLANKAPRCSYLKSNGRLCRAPALGGRYFCVFHVRSMDNQENSRIRVELLENRESLQLTVKQIMEQIVRGQIEPQTASLLLRAVQIAKSTQAPRRIRAAKRKPASSGSDAWGNPEEISG